MLLGGQLLDLGPERPRLPCGAHRSARPNGLNPSFRPSKLPRMCCRKKKGRSCRIREGFAPTAPRPPRSTPSIADAPPRRSLIRGFGGVSSRRDG